MLGVCPRIFKTHPLPQDVIRKVAVTKPRKDLRARIMSSPSKLSDDEAKSLLSFVDLLDKCLALDPSKRLTPKEALNHPFIRGVGLL